VKKLLVVALASALAVGSGVASAAPGELDPDFGTGGVVTGGLLDEFGQVTVDSAGRTVVVGREADAIAIVRYLDDGSPDPAFSGDGRVELALPAETALYVDIRVIADGSIVAIGRRLTDASDPFSNGLWAVKVSDAGVPVDGYGAAGISIENQNFTAYRESGSIAPDGSAVITQVGIGGGFHNVISASGTFSDAQLAFDFAVLPTGCTSGGFNYFPVGSARLAGGDIVHATTVPIVGCGIDQAILVSRQSPGATTATWSHLIAPPEAFDPEQEQGALWLVGTDIVLATVDGTTTYLHRLNESGDVVANWGSGGRATLGAGFGAVGDMAALPNGSLAVVNDPNLAGVTSIIVDVLNSDGTTNAEFPRYTAAAGGELRHTSVAAAPDGDLAVSAQADGTEGTVRHIEAVGLDDAVPIAPGRLLDTRPGETTVDGQFAGIGRAGAGSVTKVRVAGRAGIPADASAALLNLTIVTPDGPGFATIYPCTPTPPLASNVNYTAGSFVANSATATLDVNGDVCVFTLAPADILIDATGFVPAVSGIGTLTPARLLDTRPGEATTDGQFAGIGRPAAASVTKVRVAGRGGVPADATAAVLNLTIVTPSGAGFATIYPCTPTPPNASNINYGVGAFIANSVTAALDANGDVCVFTLASADIVLDANAYAAAGSDVGTLTPARLLDTRAGESTVDGQFAGIGRAAAGSVTTITVAGRGGIPTDATAAIVNLTVVSPSAPGFATIYPCTPTPPNASNVNYTAGAFVANGVTAKLDASGNVCIFTLAAADILVDANGYLS
jgi:hypothetical protein